MPLVWRTLSSFFTSVDGWAILLCLLGVGTGFLPWAVPGAGSTFTWTADNAFGLVRWTLPSWHGVTAVAAFAIAGLVLLATYPLGPAVWKSLLLLVAAGIALTALVLFFAWPGAGHVERWGDKEYPVKVSVLLGPSVALACGGALLLASGVYLGALLLRRRAGRQQAGPTEPLPMN